MRPSDRTGNGPVRFALRGRPGSLPPWVGPLVTTLAFWSAIVLPVLYLSLLVAGIDDTSGLLAFLGLFALHVLALVVGRSYRSGPGR